MCAVDTNDCTGSCILVGGETHVKEPLEDRRPHGEIENRRKCRPANGR